MRNDTIITAKVVGAAEVSRAFKDKQSILRERMRETMQELGDKVAARAKSAAPMGESRKGGPSPHTAGQLKRSVRVKVFDRALTLAARIAFRKHYARWVETGYGPTEERVRGHWRRDSRSNLYKTKKSGGPSKRMLAQGVVHVRPFNRVGRAAPHPFLVPAARAMSTEIMARIQATIDSAMRE